MAAKILINGVSGTGKTSLLRSLKKAFVISRDGKEFSLKIPHMTVKKFYDMSTTLYGGTVKEDNETIVVEGVFDKLEKYNEKFGEYPETVVIDSVSKFMIDIIDYANANFKNFDVHSCINAQIGILTEFVQEKLVANGVNVILINHVMENDKKGYIPIGQGKFKDKGGFFSEVDHSIFIEEEGQHYVVIHRGADYQARTMLDDIPDKQYVENFKKPEKSKKLAEGEVYYVLQEHIDKINAIGSNIADEWEI